MTDAAARKGVLAEVMADKMVVLTILVAAFGYFVDVFDLLLFNILRVPSLKDLGVPESQLLDQGVLLLTTTIENSFSGESI